MQRLFAFVLCLQAPCKGIGHAFLHRSHSAEMDAFLAGGWNPSEDARDGSRDPRAAFAAPAPENALLRRGEEVAAPPSPESPTVDPADDDVIEVWAANTRTFLKV